MLRTELNFVPCQLEAGLIPAGIVGLASQWPELETFLQASLNQAGEYNATGFFATRNYTLAEGIVAYLDVDIDDFFKNGTVSYPLVRSSSDRD